MKSPGLAVAALLACPLGCSRVDVPPRAEATLEQWSRARQALASLRATAATHAYVARVAVSIQEPRSGGAFDGRGAVAVDPSRAMRMILVGPGGATAFDAWVTPTRWRIAVPPIDLVRRGGSGATNAEDLALGQRDLPVGFFRWWFLAPLDGQLLTTDVMPRGRWFLLKSRGAIIDLRARAQATDGALELDATRREGARAERITWIGHGLAPRAGDHGEYAEALGLRVTVRVEGVGGEAPPAESFLDPDGPGGVP